MYNKVIMVGNLTRDIELRYTQSGMAIANTALSGSQMRARYLAKYKIGLRNGI